MSINKYPDSNENFGVFIAASTFPNVSSSDDVWESNDPDWAPVKPDTQQIFSPGMYQLRNFTAGTGIWIKNVDGTAADNSSYNSKTPGAYYDNVIPINKNAYLFGAGRTSWVSSESFFGVTTRTGHGIFANGFFMVPWQLPTSGAYVKISTNGTSWTDRIAANAATTASWVASVAYANGRFVVGHTTGYMSYSTDTVNWTTGNILGGSQQATRMASNGVDRIIAVNTNGSVWVSTDAINWTTGTNSSGLYPLRIRFINNRWYITNETSTNGISVSTNGTTFNNISLASVMSTGEGITDIAYASIGGADRYVATSTFHNIIVSTNGFNWTTGSTPSTRATTYQQRSLNTVMYAKGIFIAAGRNTTGNRILASTDGYSWSTITNCVTASTYSNTTTTIVYDSFGTPNTVSEDLKRFNYMMFWNIYDVNASTVPRQDTLSQASGGYFYSRFFRGRFVNNGQVGVTKVANLDINYTTTPTTA